MKLFFASDIHGSLPATERMIELYHESQADYLILLGDFLNHGPRNAIPQGYNPRAVAALLNGLKSQIIAVQGNCDSDVDQMLLEFPIMNRFSHCLLASGQKLFLTHGHVYNRDNLPALNQGDILVYGHTHIPVAEAVGDIFIFNPGSITFPKGGFAPSYGMFDSDTSRFDVIHFNHGDTLLSLMYG